MQEKNIIANTYWANNERFADIMNVGMFQEKVLIPEHLSEREGYLGHLDYDAIATFTKTILHKGKLYYWKVFVSGIIWGAI